MRRCEAVSTDPGAPADGAASNGYEAVAEEFIRNRERSAIGTEVVQAWSRLLPAGARVLDLGCGAGAPVAVQLSRAGFAVYGIDASPTLVAAFRQRLPQARVACEPVEHSRFFELQFDGVVAIGLLFLLDEALQRTLVERIAASLLPGGRFLFTAPTRRCTWIDVLTGRESRSLGRDAYLAALAAAGMVLECEYVDAGENHHFACRRPLAMASVCEG